MADLDRLLGADISHAAAEAAEAPDYATIKQRGRQRRRTQVLLTTAAVAAVTALVAAGGSLVVGADRLPPTSPDLASPTLRSMPTGDGRREQVIEPGTYRVPRSAWSSVDFTVTFPEGWTVQYGHIYHRGPDEELALEAAVVEEVFTDACREPATVEPVGPRVRDLVAALRTQPGTAAGRPVRTTLGGHPAVRVDLTVPDGLDLQTCRLADDGHRGLQVWYSESADNYLVLTPGAVTSVYVLDVDGTRQVFVALNRAPDSREARVELRSVLDSIQVED
jgi:hypothetical protein